MYASAKRGHARRMRAEARRKAGCEAGGRAYQPRAIKPVGLCRFERPAALFLVGERGRDADFRADGTPFDLDGGRAQTPHLHRACGAASPV